MTRIYVYSTLTAAQEYTGWEKGSNDLPVVSKVVRIYGGANLTTKHLITPEGAVTEISAEDEAFLLANPIFKVHAKNGFVRIDRKDMPIEKGAVGLEKRDQSAPDNPSDFREIPKERAGGVEGLKENVRAKR